MRSIVDYTDLRVFARDRVDMEPHIDTLIRLASEARTIIEWGVGYGVSTWALLDGLPANGQLYSVDTIRCIVPPRVSSDPRWKFILGNDTDPTLQQLLPDRADMVFIDTSHTYEQTSAELAAALGYNPSRIVMHDFVMEPVARAASEFCAREGWRLVANELPFGLATLEPCDPSLSMFAAATSKLNYYCVEGPDKTDSWGMSESCPCDVHFREHLEGQRIGGQSIFHFGTGGHHFVGLGELHRDNPNYVFAVTASPEEHKAYVDLVINNPYLAAAYKVMFTDIYTMHDYNLPAFDMITLFHLCEYWDPVGSGYAPLDDRKLLDLMIKKLKPGGVIIAYTGSCAWDRAEPLFEAAVRVRTLVPSHSFKSLWFLRRNESARSA